MHVLGIGHFVSKLLVLTISSHLAIGGFGKKNIDSLHHNRTATPMHADHYLLYKFNISVISLRHILKFFKQNF